MEDIEKDNQNMKNLLRLATQCVSVKIKVRARHTSLTVITATDERRVYRAINLHLAIETACLDFNIS